MENRDFASCRGCRHFEDADWKGCIARVKKTDLDSCFNPVLSKRQRCVICGSHYIFIELEGKKYCRKCSDNLKIEVKV
jgi:predicted SprT family Zn-dependent metalloprotease